MNDRKDPPPVVAEYAPRRERIPAAALLPEAGKARAAEPVNNLKAAMAQVDANEGDKDWTLTGVYPGAPGHVPQGLGPEFGTVHTGVATQIADLKLDPAKVAIKADQGKGGFELLPMDALASINEVLRYGAKKYAVHNWEKGFAWTRLGNAILRHTFAWLSGEKLDPETGLPHLAHAGCMLLFALSHQLRGIGTNDIQPSQTARIE